MRRLLVTRYFQMLLAASAVSIATWGAPYVLGAPDGEADILRQTGSAFAAIAKKVTPTVVFIQVEKDVAAGSENGMSYNDPFELFGDEFMQRFFGVPRGHPRVPRHYRQMGQGSGFLISEDGYILTNNHVVGDADRITVTLQDGRKFDAERIGSDSKSEVAVIRIRGEGFPHVKLGDSDALEIGAWVIAIGNPFGLNATVTAGIVSAKGRSNMGIADYENFIQTDAAINPGNSGGPLLNIDGEVVGINTAIYSRSGGYMGIGFAIPINMANSIKDQLVKTGKVVRGYLGVFIQEVDEDLAKSFGLDKAAGILVSQVMEDSAAAKAGLEEGDVVLELDGKELESVNVFRNTIAELAPGSKVRMKVVRDGEPRAVTATIGELPGQEGGAATAVPEKTIEKLGFRVTDITPEIERVTGYDAESGAVVSEVEMASAAWRAGLRQGTLITSVNRRPVANVKDFNDALKRARDREVLLLRVTDGTTSRYVTLRTE